MHWLSGGVTHQGAVRQTNQDAFLDRPDLGLWAVADGMGGHSDGAFASRALVEGLDGLHRPRLLGQGAREAIGTVRKVNRGLIERAASSGSDLIGSTLVAVLALAEHCAILWVGDSRVYRLRDGELRQLTTDHSHVQAMIDAGMLSPELAEIHPYSNVLLRAVGGDMPLLVDRRIERLRLGDRYLLCSDGLFRELDSETIGEILGSLPPAEAARGLVDRAYELGARDNVTALAIQLVE